MSGAEGFEAGLSALGAAPKRIGQYVTYLVDVLEGRFVGQAVQTAVAVDELGQWPLVPPHWVYLHEGVHFVRTNTQQCLLPEMLGHSRQIVGWGNDPDPAAGWLAHVRAVVGEAT